MNKTTIEARIVVLQDGYTRAINDANALSGAIQDCKYWLALLEQEQNGSSNPVGDGS